MANRRPTVLSGGRLSELGDSDALLARLAVINTLEAEEVEIEESAGTGFLNVTQSTVKVWPEGGQEEVDPATEDDLDAIYPPGESPAGWLLILYLAWWGTKVTLKDGTGNLHLGGKDIVLDQLDQAVVLFWNGSFEGWKLVAAPVPKTRRLLTVVFDGGGSAVAAGSKGYLRVPEAGTIVKWSLLAAQSGGIKIDVWKDSYANHPPTDADSITDGNEPELSSAIKAEASDLSGWSTRTLAAGDVLGFNVDSCSTIAWAVLTLEVES